MISFDATLESRFVLSPDFSRSTIESAGQNFSPKYKGSVKQSTLLLEVCLLTPSPSHLTSRFVHKNKVYFLFIFLKENNNYISQKEILYIFGILSVDLGNDSLF